MDLYKLAMTPSLVFNFNDNKLTLLYRQVDIFVAWAKRFEICVEIIEIEMWSKMIQVLIKMLILRKKKLNFQLLQSGRQHLTFLMKVKYNERKESIFENVGGINSFYC